MLYYDAKLDKLVRDVSVDIATQNKYYFERGEKRGLKTGKENAIITTIINMNKLGYTPEEITKCTTANRDFVQKILKNN